MHIFCCSVDLTIKVIMISCVLFKSLYYMLDI